MQTINKDIDILKVEETFKDLIKNEWWVLMKEYLKEVIKEIKESILNDISEKNNDKKYTEHDLSRIKLVIIKEIIEFPENKLIELRKENDIEDLDPYK